MTSFLLVVTLVILTWKTRWNPFVLLLGSIYVVTIGWTRVYLGVHYPSDIVAGWMLALAWAIGMNLLVRPMLLPSNVALQPLDISPQEAINQTAHDQSGDQDVLQVALFDKEE